MITAVSCSDEVVCVYLGIFLRRILQHSDDPNIHSALCLSNLSRSLALSLVVVVLASRLYLSSDKHLSLSRYVCVCELVRAHACLRTHI